MVHVSGAADTYCHEAMGAHHAQAGQFCSPAISVSTAHESKIAVGVSFCIHTNITAE